MKSRKFVTQALALYVVILLACVLCDVAQAGEIGSIPLQDKGVFVPDPGLRIFPSKIQFNLGGIGGPSVSVQYNWEKVNVTQVGAAVRVFNVYPHAIHVPQVPAFDPSKPIDFFFFMAVDTDTTITSPVTGLGSLPSDWVVSEASVTGTSGTEFAAVITAISDLANLPTSSPNLTLIEWDLSAFSQTTGNFYLAKVTFPNAGELLPSSIPMAQSRVLILLAVVLACVAIIFILQRRRRLAL